MTGLPSTGLRALAVVALAAVPGALARAEGLSGRIEPEYTSTVTESVDSAGLGTRTRTDSFAQKYRLALDRTLYPNLRLSAGGTLEDRMGWLDEPDDFTRSQSRIGSVFGNLTLGGPMLGGGASASHREQRGNILAANSVATMNDTYSAYAAWKPLDLPAVDLRVSRSDQYDARREQQDRTSYDAILSTAYAPIPEVDLRFSARYGDALDHRTGTESRVLDQSARVSYSESLFRERATTYLSYSLSNRSSELLLAGAGFVTTPQFPVRGLSRIEALPGQQQTDALDPNAGLVDNQFTAAGINLGYNAGDLRRRFVGAQLADAEAPVNRVFVYVDRALTPEIAATFQWTAWRSTDNVLWTQVPIVTAPEAPAGAGVVTFDPFLNRFQIAIADTRAQYLRVGTTPLLRAVTADPGFADIFVTEVQLLHVVPAAVAPRRQASTAGAFNGSARVQLYRPLSLAYDTSALFTHASDPFRTTYALSNGLSMARRLAPKVGFSARVARSDSDQSLGHESNYQYSASLTADPLATLSAGLAYSGGMSFTEAGSAQSNAVTTFARAALYEGWDAFATANWGLGSNAEGQDTRSRSFAVGTSVVPHRRASLAANYASTHSRVTGGGRAPSDTSLASVEGNASLNPIGTLYLSAGVLRTLSGTPTTLANFAASASAFPQGGLLLSVGYSTSLDTANERTLRMFQSSARLTIRRGSYLEVGYSMAESEGPVETSKSRSFFSRLIIPL